MLNYYLIREFLSLFFFVVSIHFTINFKLDIMAPKKTKKTHDEKDAVNNTVAIDIAEQLINLEQELVARLALVTSGRLKLKNSRDVQYVYNPLEYAAGLHNQFVRKYCTSPKKVLLLGMNPGPWGMCQTGIPFGEVNAVRDYLKIEGDVEQPKNFHPKRKIEGLNCKRSEVSGKRLWELIKTLSNNDPFVFFKECFVYNYLPLAFLGISGLNITPPDLKSDDQATLNSICDEFLLRTVKLLNVRIIIALGRYVEKRANDVFLANGIRDIRVCYIVHPSPRNKGSGDWQKDTIDRLNEYGLTPYLQ